MRIFFFLFLLYKLTCTQFIRYSNYSLSLNESALAMTFGLDWIVWATTGPTIGTSLIKMNKSGTTYLNATKTTKSIVQLKVYQDTLDNNSIIYAKSISMSYIFQIFRIVNGSASLKYTSSMGVIAFFFYKSQAAQFMIGTMAYFINLTTYTQISNLNLNGGNILLSMNPYSDYNIIFNSIQPANLARGAYNVLDAYNYSQSLRFNSSYINFTQCTNSNYDAINQLFVRICYFRIQVWFVPNNTAMLTRSLNYSTTNYFTNAIVCGQYFVILSQTDIQFYNLSDWSLLFKQAIAYLQNYPSLVSNQLKCLTPNKIGFSGQSAQSGLKTVYFIDFYESNTNSTPSSIPNSTQTYTPSTPSTTIATITHSLSLLQKAVNFLNSQFFNTTSIVVATLASIFSSTTAFKQILKPFAYLMEELWYYGCHSIRYTDFIDDLSKQADLLNEIKIKPKFLDQINININYFQDQNSLYLNSNVLNKRSTDEIYSLLSIQDIYTFNLVQGFALITLFYVLRKVCRFLKAKHKLFKVLYKQFYINSLWWNFLVITIENNIGPITYHCVIQFNCLFSFNFNHKYNHLFAVVAFYTTCMYCYTFYRLLFRYAKKKHSSHLLSVGVFTYLGFWLQTTLTCHRRVSVAFAHAWLTNRHFEQVLFLIVCDIIILYIVIKLRQHFRTKFSLLMSWGYFFGFLFFDLGIFIGTEIIFKDNLQQFNDSLFFNYYYFILIIFLSLITLLKILNSMGIMMKSIFKKAFKSNQIEEEEKTKKQSDLSDDQKDKKQKQKQKSKLELKDNVKLQLTAKPFVDNQQQCKSEGQSKVLVKVKMKVEKNKKTEKNINPNLLKVQSTKKIQKIMASFQQHN